MSPKSSSQFSRSAATVEEKKGSDEDLALDTEMELHSKLATAAATGNEDYCGGGGGNTTTLEDDFVPQTPRSRDHVSTPTDFAVDYGKSGSSNAGTLFDTSNVLAWLQSPTAHGLFSPGGGLGSLMNTPAGGTGIQPPRTPRTPIVSTSFFFSDVASLPKTMENTTTTTNHNSESPRPGEGCGKSSLSLSSSCQRGTSNNNNNNIICISPLASSRGPGTVGGGGRPDMAVSFAAANTPLNFQDIFASPKERGKMLPLLGDTPSRSTERLRGKTLRGPRGDPSLDAVHLAERDLLEDEDLSVLLQLASNTPGSKHGSGVGDACPSGAVFRSPPGLLKKGADAGLGQADNGADNSFPGLELPMIGSDADAGSNKARLQQKISSGRNGGLSNNAFGLPQLGMRSSSSHGSSSNKDQIKTKTSGGEPNNQELDAIGASSAAPTVKSSNSAGSLSNANPYHMAPPYPPPGPGDMHPYYNTMSGMPTAPPPGSTGTMRVAVGGNPPSRRNSSTGGKGSNNNNKSANPPSHPSPYHDYAHPPGSLPPYPPPHGMFSSYPAPAYHGIGRYPQYSHYPPPPQQQPQRQIPMYNNGQRPPSTTSTTGTVSASTKDANKRNSSNSKTTKATVGGSNGAVGNNNNNNNKPSMHGNKRSLPTSSSLSSASGTPGPSRTTSTMLGSSSLATTTGQQPPAVTHSVSSSPSGHPHKKQKKSPGERTTSKKKNRSPPLTDRGDREKAAATIHSVNQASGCKNDKAAALAAAILRGVTMRPSGKWQAQLYFAGKSRYIGVFDTREKAALAYEIAREKLKSGPSEAGGLSAKSTENLVNTARKAAFDGVNERLPK